MYNSFLREPTTDFVRGFSFDDLDTAFHGIKFRGVQTVKTIPNPDNKGGYVTTIESATNPEWERDILARLRAVISASARPVEQIFNEMDVDRSGTLNVKEFRNAIRQLQLGLTSKEIDQVMRRIDQNQDGVVDYQEFVGVLGLNQGYNRRMAERANNKLAELKERMTTYLVSHSDAYRKFDSSNVGRMSFMDFQLLVSEMATAAKAEVPAYFVIKDLFDAVDIKRDGFIDLKEWN
jgi:Ca2+-binding EF-hand superfamily protein